MINSIKIEETWGFDHYLVYLYLCIANADYNLANEELEELDTKFEKLTIDDKNYSIIIKDVLHEYKNHTDYEMNQIIIKYSEKFCKDAATKEKILKDLQDIIEADGIVKDVESIMFMNIKKILNG